MAGEKLILTGFMGAGKSTVGRSSADILGVTYNDTDDWMEVNAGVDIAELVRTNMAMFRELEADALTAILEKNPGVISTGGGIVSTEIGRKALLKSGVPVVWLQVPFGVTARRVMQDTGRKRPLYQDLDAARALYEDRKAWYKETASYTVDASQPLKLVVDQVVKLALSPA